MKKNLLVITQYFYPEQFRINDICKEWVTKGYNVTVVTGVPNYPEGKFYHEYSWFKNRSENIKGINVVRLPIIPRGNNSLMLILNYLSFVVAGFFWQMFTKYDADKVFIYEVSPMTQALPGIWYSKRKKIPAYIYVTDLWPENVVVVAKIKNKKIINSIGKMVDYIYANSERIFTSSRTFIDSISLRGVDRNKIEYWPQYSEDYYKPLNPNSVEVSEIKRNEYFNITFAGNIGYAQGLEILPEVAKSLKNKNAKVRFNIIGDGRFKEELISLVRKNNVEEYFKFIEKQPSVRIPEYLCVSDAALISLSRNDVFSLTIPAKTQSCLACGIPILVSGDGEIQRVAKESKAGFYSDAQDYKGLAKNILKMIDLTVEERD